jgi:anaerobic selenocysteine-containing dehydrogenase
VGFAELKAVVDQYPPERVADICGIAREDLEKAAEWIGTTPRVVSTVLQGFYQSVEATASSSLVNTVHLLTGAIGKPGAGPLLMAGQPSAMCNREAGAGGSYPGYRNPKSELQMRDLCERWNIDFDTFRREPPKDILSMMELAERGEIEFMWVIGTNPLVSLPDQNRSARILEKLFLVVQDPFIDAETIDLADIYFPAAMWGEKTGCVTNAERSVNLLLKAVEPPGQARSDFDLFIEVANKLSFKDRDGSPLIPFRGPRDAFEEWRKVSKGRPCDYSGMTYELILQMGAVRWPCNDRYPRGAERLYEDLKFWTGIDDCETYGADFLTGNQTARSDYERVDPKGKAFLKPVHWRRQPNPVSAEHPFVLITGRVVYHFHTRTKTGRSVELNEHAPHAYVEIYPEDASRLDIALGDRVEITSPHQVGGRGHGGRHRPTGRALRTLPLWARRSVGQPAYLVCPRSRQSPASVEIVTGGHSTPQFRPTGTVASGASLGTERRTHRAVCGKDIWRDGQRSSSGLADGGPKKMAKMFKIGDHVTWNSEAGRVSGTIIAIHTQDFPYKGHVHHASEQDPQYEIKSDRTDHIAAHKGSALEYARESEG